MSNEQHFIQIKGQFLLFQQRFLKFVHFNFNYLTDCGPTLPNYYSAYDFPLNEHHLLQHIN